MCSSAGRTATIHEPDTGKVGEASGWAVDIREVPAPIPSLDKGDREWEKLGAGSQRPCGNSNCTGRCQLAAARFDI